ncbi:hypothetical protein [Yeosuana sp.]|uniref:hypothetical protein n=1 Tax=Yeosuana sp. TaxID=2529388 RepID=UPI00404B686C
MKTVKDIQEIILDQFRKTNSRAGYIVMMRVFHFSVIPKLNPKEQDLFQEAANDLINQGILEYEKTSPECLRLTDKGFENLYNVVSEHKEQQTERNTSDTTTNTKMNNPFAILKEAIDKVPFVKYALGIAGIAAAVAIIRSFGIDNSSVPIISILVMLGFMVLLFLFSTLTKSKERPLKIAGYVLVYTTVLITCVSSVLLATSVFFDVPKPIEQYGIFKGDSTSSSYPNIDNRLVKEAYSELDETVKNILLPFSILYENTCFDQNYQHNISCDAEKFATDFNFAVSELEGNRFIAQLDSIDFRQNPRYPDVYPNALWWEIFSESATRNQTKVNELWNKYKEYYTNDTKIKINSLLNDDFFKMRLTDLETLIEANDHMENYYISYAFIKGPDEGKMYKDFLKKLKELKIEIDKNASH